MSLQIQLKKSAVSQKQPFASDLAVGELALNYNADGPFLTCKDSAGNVRKLNHVWVGATAPTSPGAGDQWLDTSAATAVLKVYKDSSSTWVNATTIPIATTSVYGTVRLATTADVTNGTSGKIVDAAQLQSKVSEVLSNNVNLNGNLTVNGDLTVDGTTTTIETTTLTVEDKNIEMGVVATPTDTTADGGGITLKGATDKTINWVNATDAWTSSERFNLPAGTAAAPSLILNGDVNSGLYSPGADQVAISTNGIERLRIDSSGRIGAGDQRTSTGISFRLALPATGSVYTTQVYALGQIQSDVTNSHTVFKSLGQTQAASFTLGTVKHFSAEQGTFGAGSAVNSQFGFIVEPSVIGASSNYGFFSSIPSGTGRWNFYSNGTADSYFASNNFIFANGGTEKARINSSGRLGLGTSSPDALLTVNGVGAHGLGSAAAPSFAFTGDLNTGLYSPGADQVAISTGGTGRLFVDANGKVGLGNSSPDAGGLVITSSSDGGIGGSIVLENSNNSDTDKVGIALRPNGSATTAIGSYGEARIISEYVSGSTNGANNLQFWTHSGDGTIAQAVHIDSSQRVGIGTTTFGGKLTVKTSSSNGAPTTWGDGQLVVTAGDGTTAPGFGVSTNTSDDSVSLSALTPGTGWNTIRYRAASHIFYRADAASNEVGRFDASGRLLVGTSSTSLSSKFVLQGDTSSANNGGYMRLQTGNSIVSGTSLGSIGFGDAANNGALIEAKGDVSWSPFTKGARIEFSTTADGASTPTARMTIKNDGKVGIGTADIPSDTNLTVLGNYQSGFYRNITSGNRSYTINLGSKTSTGFADGGSISGAVESGDSTGYLYFGTRTGGSITEKARIDSDGRLLVGTSTASLSNKFALQGDTSSANNGGYMRLRTGNSIVSGTSLGSIGFGDAANNGALIEAKGDVSWSPFTKGSRIEFSTTADGASTPTERMRIAQNGGIGIGNISADYAGGVYATSVKLTLHSEASVNNVNVPLEIYNGPSTSTRYSAIFSNGNGIVGSISTTGSATTYSTSSDYRLKENVIPLTGAADRLNQLQVCRFNFIADPDNTVDGFIAHEAQAVVPEAVTGTHDEVDADGNPVYQGIDQSKLVPLLTAALQEALQKIETLEQRLNDAGIA